HVEHQRQRDPDRAPPRRLARTDIVRAPMEDAEIDGQHRHDEEREAGVEPPVLGERKEGHDRRLRVGPHQASIDISAATIRFGRCRIVAMAATYSFDVTSNIDMPEVDNAVNQARKEIGQRFDFKGSIAAIDLDQKANTLTLTAEDNFKLESVWAVLQTRLIKRNVPVKNMKRGDIEPAAGATVKQVITLQQGIPSDAAKDIVKHLKDLKLKTVKARIHAD